MIFTNKLLNASIIIFGIYHVYNYYSYINHKLTILDIKYTTLTNKYDLLYNNLNKMIMDLYNCEPQLRGHCPYNNYYISHKQINKNDNNDNNDKNDNNDSELSFMRID